MTKEAQLEQLTDKSDAEIDRANWIALCEQNDGRWGLSDEHNQRYLKHEAAKDGNKSLGSNTGEVKD